MIDWGKRPPVGCMLIMKRCTRMKLVPFALCAMGALMLVFTGCRKEEEKKPEAPASSSASYVHDKAFMGSLAAARAEQSRLIKSRNEIARKMVAMIEAKQAEMKTDDMKAVRAELEKDAAWRELHAACTNANAQVKSQRRELLGKVRERITPKGSGARRSSATSGKDSASPLGAASSLNKGISK